jgi:hypothetical protein
VLEDAAGLFPLDVAGSMASGALLLSEEDGP